MTQTALFIYFLIKSMAAFSIAFILFWKEQFFSFPTKITRLIFGRTFLITQDDPFFPVKSPSHNIFDIQFWRLSSIYFDELLSTLSVKITNASVSILLISACEVKNFIKSPKCQSFLKRVTITA